MKRRAFTLAEVLITLGVIGVVAALTIPTLIAKYQEKQTIITLKKDFNLIANAINLAIAENGEPKDWGTKWFVYGENDEASNYFTITDNLVKKLKVIKDCGYRNTECFPNRYKDLNNYIVRDFNEAYFRKIILPDGAALAFYGPGNAIELWIDINGNNKKPNIFGKDLFLFYYKNNKFAPYQIDSLQAGTASPYNSYATAAWIITYDNMDYLHCNDLSVANGKTKCN